MILLTSLELVFVKLNVELHDPFFILGSGFCKFELECSIIGIFELDTVFAKKTSL